MDWLLPLALTGCYTFYLQDVPWRADHWGWKLAFTGLLAAALWAGHQLASPIPWYAEFVLSYGALFLSIWGARNIRALDSLYHVLILFLATDCLLRGIRHMSMIMWGKDYLYDTSCLPLHLLFLGITVALMLGALYMVRRIVFQEERQLVSATQVFLMLLTLLPILYLTNIHQWLGIAPSMVGLDTSAICIILSLCGLIAILGNESMYRSRLLAQEVRSMEAMLLSQSQQNLMKVEYSEMIMQSCHDLKNQLYALQHSNGVEAKEAYIAQLQKIIDQYDSLYHTGNETLDIVLSEKGLRCRENGIDLVCIVQGELLSQLAPVDICTIFGNALDNAIEGSSQAADRKTRTIQVKMAQEKGFLVIRFENPYEHDLNWSGTRLITTKAGKLSHGYGLKGIMHTVDKYQGHMVIDTDNGKFVLTLLLPCD